MSDRGLSLVAVGGSEIRTPTRFEGVVDEGKTYHGLGQIRAWRTGPAIKYTYTTEVLDLEVRSAGRYLVTGRLTGNFPGETVDLRCDFAVTSDLISRLVIAP